MPPLIVRVSENPEELGEALAGLVLARLEASGGNPFRLGCPAGRSLLPTYRALARRLPRELAAKLEPVLMDEYLLAGEHGALALCPAGAHYSCRGFAAREIQAPLGLTRPLRLPDPARPEAFDAELAAAGGVDLFLLASGASDGHVAMNPPGSDPDGRSRVVALAETTRADNLATFKGFASLAEVPRHGVSVGLGTIAALAREAVMVVTGAHKREAARRLLAASAFDPAWPATILHRCRGARLWLDEAAAGGVA
jgi:glucosamine-6-phosphate deaminase